MNSIFCKFGFLFVWQALSPQALVFSLNKMCVFCGSKMAQSGQLYGRLDRPRARVGNSRPQQSPGWATRRTGPPKGASVTYVLPTNTPRLMEQKHEVVSCRAPSTPMTTYWLR